LEDLQLKPRSFAQLKDRQVKQEIDWDFTDLQSIEAERSPPKDLPSIFMSAMSVKKTSETSLEQECMLLIDSDIADHKDHFETYKLDKYKS